MYFLFVYFDYKTTYVSRLNHLHHGCLTVCSDYHWTRDLEKYRTVLVRKENRLQLDCDQTKGLRKRESQSHCLVDW